ncbi:MAG: TonB-dependent receptor [Bacteroidota bacterium]
MRLRLIHYLLSGVLLFLFLFNNNAFAGETGKIAGFVLDKNTGEPLIGANIVVIAKWVDGKPRPLDALLGASTDVVGEYFILNISPGLYSVKASYVGYKAEVITNVNISVDKTTEVNFNLEDVAFESEEVVVTAFSPQTVEKDVTATKQVYNIRDVESIAGVADIADILELQADVVDDHFRGGRVGESLYLMGGGSIVNPLNNRRAFKPITTALEQVEVYTSGFSAEYGNAQSGVVNMITREGGDAWETRVEFAGKPPYYKTWGGSPFAEKNLYFYNILASTDAWLEENPTQPGRALYDLGYGFGPAYLPPRNVWPPNPLTTAESLYVARIGQIGWLQSVRDVGLEYDNTPDYRLDFTVGGPIADRLKLFVAGRQSVINPIVPTPDKDNERQLMSNLTYQHNEHNKFQFRFVYDRVFENVFNSSWERWLFDRTFSVTKSINTTLQYGLSWNHIINNSTVMDIKFNILDALSEERIDLLQNNEFLEDYSSKTNWVDFTGPSYHRVGRLNDDRGDQQNYTYDLHGSIYSQMNKNNLVKAGLQFNYYDVDVAREMNITNPASFRDVRFLAYPYEGAFYLQNKMEYLGFIANVGVRFDFYNFNANYYADEFSPLRNPDYDESLPYLERGQYYDRELAAREKSKLFTKMQPRIGISFPLSETAVFHLNYGTFTQRPSFNQIFYSQVTMFNEIEILGNPRLKPENTKAYDIGLVQAFPYGFKLDVSAYYKDVTNLVETAYYYDEQQAVYRTYKNRDYADIKGFHVSVEKNEGAVRGYLRYNYESTTGKSSNDLNAPVIYFENPPEGQESIEIPDAEDVYLDYDRTHKAVANIRYVTSSNTGFEFGDIYPLGNISISLTYKYYTGRPYTWDESGQGLKYNQRTPDENDMRIRIEKRFKLGNTGMTVYVEGFNLLNEKIYSYSRTFEDERNTPKWELDRENVLVYDEYKPYVSDQSIHLLSNEPRNFRLGVLFKF